MIAQFGQDENRKGYGHLLARSLVVALCLVAPDGFAADSSLPNILANNNRAPAGRLDSGILTLHLELREGAWHPEAEDGRAVTVYSFAEEGHDPATPGPLIRVPQGTELRVSVHNRLRVAAEVHGLHQRPGKADDYLELAPDETEEARFTAGEPGSYLYWASSRGGQKVRRRAPASERSIEARPLRDGMMSGALIVDQPGFSTDDRIFVIQAWARDLFTPNFVGVLSINGKSWPYTERLHARRGQADHWRIVNATPLEHPMHLHGFYFYVDAVSDGETQHAYPPRERRMVVTEPVPGGHTFDMTWVPERAGNWIFHCHILDHMMGHYKSPVLYGPDGAPQMSVLMHDEDDPTRMGMGELVMGITVSGDSTRLVQARAMAPPAAERHLYVRERPASLYAPAGPGFFLEGVSRAVEPVGPPIVIQRGERTAITVHNQLKEATAIHWHGLEIESYYDGVPLWDGTPQHATPYIAPGNSFTAFMTPPHAGTFIYHTHWNDVRQLTGGMYGALLVLEPGQKYDSATDKVFVLGRAGINEMRDPLVLNGSPQPGLMVLLTGQTYRLRLINITPNDATVHTTLTLEDHPAKWRAIAKDGADLPEPQATFEDAVKDISVGETYDFGFAPKEPGDYELKFRSLLGSEVTQMIAVVPPGSAFSVYAAKR